MGEVEFEEKAESEGGVEFAEKTTYWVWERISYLIAGDLGEFVLEILPTVPVGLLEEKTQI